MTTPNRSSSERSGPLRPTPSVNRAIADFGTTAISSLDLALAILKLHREYGARRGAAVVSADRPSNSFMTAIAQQWIAKVTALFDPDVALGPLHGRLMILGLCELDSALRDHLEGFGLVSAIETEQREDFGSLLRSDRAGESAYRNRYIKLLQNRAKLDARSTNQIRTQGFVVAVRGGPGLEGLAELSHRQTYNHCLTARYVVPLGRSLDDALSEFVRDMGTLARGDGTPSGSLLPDPAAGMARWRDVANGLASIADRPGETGTDTLAQVASRLQTLLTTGQRLVLLMEMRRVPEGASPEEVGLSKPNVSRLANLPERVGVVLSGISEETVDQAGLSDVTWLDLPRDRALTRGQAPSNDVPAGPDRLGVLSEVNALAEAVALKDMRPPMVVGIMGGWGAGKSFVLHLFENRIQEIRCEPMLGDDSEVDDNFPFVGHPYLIRFDAWTYAKGNLWASLMQQIFVQLDRQVGLEHTLRSELELTPDQQTEVWRLLSSLSDEQRRRLSRTELGQRAIELAAKHDSGRVTESQLWSQLEKLRASEIDELNKDEATLAKARVERDVARAELDDLIDDEIRRDALQATWETATDAVIKAAWNQRQESASAQSTDPPTIAEMRKVLTKNRTLWSGLRGPALLAFMTFLLAGVAVAAIAGFTSEISAFFSGAAAIVGSAITTMRRVQDSLAAKRAGFDSSVDARRRHSEEQRREWAADILRVVDSSDGGVDGDAVFPISKEMRQTATALRKHETDIAGLETAVEARRQRVGMAARHTNLLDFVRQRLEGRYYEDKLGLLHQVKSDLEQLSDALLSTDQVMRELFPRGMPRVFLLIDDLDRCPPDKVVEVLEAAQLLVKTPLFVVLIAMDVRYVTRALEKEYVGVLIRGGDPSGLDYIEKIIQIPYRVRPAPHAAVEGFLRFEMGIVERRDPDAVLLREAEQGSGEGERSEEDASEVDVEPGRLGSARAADTELRVLPTDTVDFTEQDHRLVAASCTAFDVSPRTMKRLVNVLKLLKIIWYRRGLDDGPPENVKRTMLAVLAVAARYPEVMRHLLHTVERRFAAREKLDENLIDYLKERCATLRRTAVISADWAAVGEALDNQGLFPPKVLFSELREENLRLVATFSFIGESDPEREAALQKQGGDASVGSMPSDITVVVADSETEAAADVEALSP